MMDRDNSVYTVTSPDLFLTEDGMSVLISSTNKNLVESIKNLFEKYIPSSIVFNLQQKQTNESNFAWFYHVTHSCDLMIVDLDTCAWIDIATALTKQVDENHVLMFYTEKHKKREAEKLINAQSKWLTINSIQQFDAHLKAEIQ